MEDETYVDNEDDDVMEGYCVGNDCNLQVSQIPL